MKDLFACGDWVDPTGDPHECGRPAVRWVLTPSGVTGFCTRCCEARPPALLLDPDGNPAGTELSRDEVLVMDVLES